MKHLLRCKKQDLIKEHPKQKRTIRECRLYFHCIEGCLKCPLCEKINGEEEKTWKKQKVYNQR